MKRFSQTVKIGLALFMAVFSSGLLPAASASAYSMTNPGNHYKKVYVCKYVGTPGQNEQLQTGDNPISVSVNAIQNFQGLGSYFNDAQGRSYVVAWDNGNHQEPPVSMCPAPQGPTVISVPAIPSVNDPCGVGNATWITPVDTTQIDWTLKQNGDLVADTKPGYIFSDQTTTHNYGKAVDSGVLCVVVVETPPAPAPTDPCGFNNAYWTVPANTTAYTWSQENGHLIVTANAGYSFANGVTTVDFGLAKDSNVPCVIDIPATPGVNDPCGKYNARWIVPQDTAQIDWVLEHDGDLIAKAMPGYIFSNWKTTVNFGRAIDSNKPCIIKVKPLAPKFVDNCGTVRDEVWIPYVKGVQYQIDGVDVSAGRHAIDGNATVTAEAKYGYVIPEYAQTSWSYEFTAVACISITKSADPVADTNGDGRIGIGDVVTWQITVTNNASNWYENFKVQVDDSNVTLENDGRIDTLAPGESVTLSATSALTESDLKACKATNIAQFFAWYQKPQYHHTDKDSSSRTLQFTFDDGEEYDEFDLSGESNEAVAEFTCPTPGSGGSDEPETPTDSEELPDMIPATGATSVMSPLLTVAATVIAYGATLFLQERRKLAHESTK